MPYFFMTAIKNCWIQIPLKRNLISNKEYKQKKAEILKDL